MATLELNKEIANNFNPKIAFNEAKFIGPRHELKYTAFPGWEIVPEANIVVNKVSQSNATLGLRWRATDSLSLDFYASTAASIVDIEQLISAEKVG